jgi:DNA repair protein RecO (recombination protein O)
MQEGVSMAMVGCEGIVLRVRDFNEADRILTILSAAEGKFEAVARGARRPRSSMAGAAQLFTRANMMLFRGRSLDTLSSAEVLSTHQRVRSDLACMAYGSYIAELTDAMTAEREPAPDVYSLVCSTLAALDRKEARPAVVALGFEMKFLSLIGFKPELRQCVSCGAREPEADWFGPNEGGLLCARCRANDLTAVPVGDEARGLLRALMVRPYARLSGVGENGKAYVQARTALRRYVDLRVESSLRTLEFIDDVNSMGREEANDSEGGLEPDRQVT